MIAVFGDSIAFGHNDLKGGWATRLKKDFEIINRSISGEDSIGLLNRLKKSLDELQPDIIIIAIGINDSSIFYKNHRVQLKDFKKTYSLILELSKVYSKKIICLGLTRVDESLVDPIPWNTLVSYDNKSVEKYDSAIKKIAEKNKAEYICLFDLLEKKDLDDGLHPNSKGHQKLYKEIKKQIKKLKV